MSRPSHLPDFENPPLDEVVLGIQFAPCPTYNSVLAKDVWQLFANEFPNVYEQPLLPPQFEVFGGRGSQHGPRIEFGPPPIHNRLWFTSADESHLIQFQDDRLLLNWRRRPSGVEYPRYQKIAADFRKYAETLFRFFEEFLCYKFEINQAEITYVNIVKVNRYSEIGDWLSIVSSAESDFEGVNLNLAQIIQNREGKPIARLHHELLSVTVPPDSQKALRLNLTFRGRPSAPDIGSALEFLFRGREAIVKRFCEITTSSAHESWRRIV
jgi:uncharacterized protein (TIGR04255 family)